VLATVATAVEDAGLAEPNDGVAATTTLLAPCDHTAVRSQQPDWGNWRSSTQPVSVAAA
jgi:hypothetical protein